MVMAITDKLKIIILVLVIATFVLLFPIQKTKTIEANVESVKNINDSLYLITFDTGEKEKIHISNDFIDLTNQSKIIFRLQNTKPGFLADFDDSWTAMNIIKIDS